MRAERWTHIIQWITRINLILCKKKRKFFFHSATKKRIISECKRRPEFKSFFHKSFRKTDYSIIPRCHVRINKWIYNWHSYTNRTRFPAPIVGRSQSTNRHTIQTKQRKRKIEINTDSLFLLKNASNLSYNIK